MKRRLIRPELIVGILLGLTAQLGGQGQGGQGQGGQGQVAPVITNAVANLDAVPPTIFVFGTNFGPSPQVFIGNDMGTLDPLVVISSTNTFIEAELVSIDPATCPLVVSNGPSTQHLSEMDVTIGAVGPEGPVGPPGTPNPNIITEDSPTFNTAIGVSALVNTTTGGGNTASGTNALRRNTTGNNNTASGLNSLINNTTGSGNTASGAGALNNNTTGNSNTASGNQALAGNTSGDANTASGNAALRANTTGSSNTASGARALLNNTTGTGNTASGVAALNGNTTGGHNTASGVAALASNTTGTSNTATGFQALASNTTGVRNTASGELALFRNTTGSDNTVSGFAALSKNTTGINNTANGVGTLTFNTTGSGNIALGYFAGSDATTGDNNIFIGNPGVAAESDTIRIGTGGVHMSAFIAGVPIVVPSSKRFKEDIRDMGQASTSLMRLRPVTFRYKKEYDAGDHRLQYGLIAEEVAEVYPELVVHDDTGRVRTVIYQELNVMLLNELQKQHQVMQQQQIVIGNLMERLSRLEGILPPQESLTSLTE